MSIESTMVSGGAEEHGGGGVKTGGNLDSTFSDAAKPGMGGVNAINDRNKAPFDKPRSGGGIPVKFFEQVSGSPGPLESTLENKNIVR
jgi:hypothetical protein